MAQKRAYIPLPERLASALADKLPQQQRDDLRARKVPADEVIALFTPDHVALHCWSGENRWFNLDMRLRGPELKAKDAADTSRAAKAIRIDKGTAEHRRSIMAKDRGEPKQRSRWAQGRKLESRGFQKRATAST